MALRVVPGRRLLGLASLSLALSTTLVLLPGSEAFAAHEDCRLTIRGPFFYAGLVFPVAEVDCDTEKQSIQMLVALDADGSEVATASRTCRKATRCWLGLASDGIFATDLPGDQAWCGRASATIHTTGPRHSIGEVRSCEAEAF